MSPHHSDQMSQRSQVSALGSPIELFWTAKKELISFTLFFFLPDGAFNYIHNMELLTDRAKNWSLFYQKKVFRFTVNFKMYFFKFLKIFVQIVKCICRRRVELSALIRSPIHLAFLPIYNRDPETFLFDPLPDISSLFMG